MENKSVSFVIRTRNVENDLPRCIDSILSQYNPTKNEIEIIIVDNESIDSTIEIAKNYGAKIITITQEDFTWGRSLNLGIEQATGDIVILMSADVSAKNNMWLSEMLEPFKDENIAAVYAKQEPRLDAPIDERARLAKTFPEQSVIFLGKPDQIRTNNKIIASNACAAIRKNVWDQVPYDEVIEGGEEVQWTEEVQSKGYDYIYNSEAKVYHSHNEPASRFAYRHWELHCKNVRVGKIKPGIFYVLHATASITKRRLKNIFNYKAPLKIKLEGFISLFPEIILFMLIAILEGLGLSERKVRRWMW